MRGIEFEGPQQLLIIRDDEVTPVDRLFVRNNGIPPASVDPAKWKLEIGGESVARPRTFTPRRAR